MLVKIPLSTVKMLPYLSDYLELPKFKNYLL